MQNSAAADLHLKVSLLYHQLAARPRASFLSELKLMNSALFELKAQLPLRQSSGISVKAEGHQDGLQSYKRCLQPAATLTSEQAKG